MNKKLLTLLIGLLLIGITTAGMIGISVWEKEIDLTKEHTDQIKLSAGINKIDIKISQIKCDDNTCWAWAKQKDVINSKWTSSKNYCSNYSEHIEESLERTCLEYTDYTTEELKEKVNDYIENKLKNWADAEINRSSGNIEVKTDVGTITSKSSVREL